MANLKDSDTISRIAKMKRRSTNRHLDAFIYGEEIEKLYRKYEFLMQRIEELADGGDPEAMQILVQAEWDGYAELENQAEEEKTLDYSDIYGYLYNWWAAVDERKITSSDTWQVPSAAQWLTLREVADPESIGTPTFDNTSNDAGDRLKHCRVIRDQFGSEDLPCKISPDPRGIHFDPHPRWNEGGINIGNPDEKIANPTDDFNFSVIPTGSRSFDHYDNAIALGATCVFWTRSTWTTSLSQVALFSHTRTGFAVTGYETGESVRSNGYPLRLVRDASQEEQLLDDGASVNGYTGNDGKTYPAVKIGTQVWTAKNLEETQFRNGDDILEVRLDNENWPTGASPASARSPILYVYDDPALFVVRANGFVEKNYTIDWGDGTIEENQTDTTKTHEYPSAGQYTIQINGAFNPNFKDVPIQYREHILELKNWGTYKFKELYESFRYCRNMVVTAQDVPDLSEIHLSDPQFALSQTFRDCDSIGAIPRIGEWDVSNLFQIQATFMDSGFTGDISDWDIRGLSPDGNRLAHLLDNTNLSIEMYDKLLNAWGDLVESNNGPARVTLGAVGLVYSSTGEVGRNKLVNDFEWTINGDSLPM